MKISEVCAAYMMLHPNFAIAIVEPSKQKLDSFHDEVLSLYESIPSWLAPPLNVLTKKELKAPNGTSIYFVRDIEHMRGRTLQGVFAADEVYESVSQYMKPHGTTVLRLYKEN